MADLIHKMGVIEGRVDSVVHLIREFAAYSGRLGLFAGRLVSGLVSACTPVDAAIGASEQYALLPAKLRRLR